MKADTQKKGKVKINSDAIRVPKNHQPNDQSILDNTTTREKEPP